MGGLIQDLIGAGKVTNEDLNELIRAGKLEAYLEAVSRKFHPTQGSTEIERKAIGGIAEELRKDTWEINHQRIKAAILNHLGKKNSMPTVSEIAKTAELSRQTVYAHLKEFDLTTYHQAEMQKYKAAFVGIMDLILARCMRGDLAAMRLYFEIMAFSSRRNPEARFLLDGKEEEPIEGEGLRIAYVREGDQHNQAAKVPG